MLLAARMINSTVSAALKLIAMVFFYPALWTPDYSITVFAAVQEITSKSGGSQAGQTQVFAVPFMVMNTLASFLKLFCSFF